MATKKKETKPAAKVENKAKDSKKKMTDEEKAAKKKARLEAIKNRPAGQRPNSRQIDVIAGENGGLVKNFGHVVKVGREIIGVLVTSVAYDEKGNVLSSSVAFVPGTITIKAKKGHGNFSKPKSKGSVSEADDAEEEEETED